MFNDNGDDKCFYASLVLCIFTYAIRTYLSNLISNIFHG